MTPIRLPLVAATALLATVLAACGTTEDASDGSSESSGEKITLTDSRGKEITLDGPATRVAATEWNAAEYLVSLGVQPVGVSDVKGFATWDSAVELGDDVTDLGTRGEPSLDTLASLDLDALVVTDTLAGDAVEQIEKTIPVIVLPGGKVREYRTSVRSAVPSAGATTRKTVNVTSIDNYTLGVVAARRQVDAPVVQGDGNVKQPGVDAGKVEVEKAGQCAGA